MNAPMSERPTIDPVREESPAWHALPVADVAAGRDVVPGDLLFLEAGQQVPADARLLDASNLRLDESSLTGESLPVEKDAGALLAEGTPPDDRTNLVFMGTAVTHGRGRALVVATG